jgi:flagellar motility protein MotE (MotC chaperone)
MGEAKKGLSREQASQLYRDLQGALITLQKRKAAAKAGRGAAPVAEAAPASTAGGIAEDLGRAARAGVVKARLLTRGHYSAVVVVLMFAASKVLFSFMEYSGTFSAPPADAAMNMVPQHTVAAAANAPFSREEVKVLMSLDKRRAELEDRSGKLTDRERDLESRENAMVVKFSELRELTEEVRQERDKGEKKRKGQIDQLANVYGSMDPNEAAALMSQLDTAIALSMLERMPEKRIGQILAMMPKDKALMLTRLLSSR